ncbi:MAG: elongation factor P [Candidatus Omnitrophica bacterium]|nr:elongation factor P [Candidatus Omnitrophota bacterium]
MISANQFKNGLTLVYEGDIYTVIEYQQVKPGKGGAFTRTKLKNLRSKKILDRTFRVEEKFEEAFVEEKKTHYLYNSGDTYHFMDQDSFEELSISAKQIDTIIPYLKENAEVTVIIYNGAVIEVKLPIFLELKIAHTEPGIKGDTARSSFKPATLETGATIQVPLFINENDTIKIDTRTGEYVERA